MMGFGCNLEVWPKIVTPPTYGDATLPTWEGLDHVDRLRRLPHAGHRRVW